MKFHFSRELRDHTGDSETPFLFNGKYGVMSDDNGLCYMRARYYSPQLLRFINADPEKGMIADGATLNAYAYANGNPISYVDPFGASAELSQAGHIFLDAAGMILVVGMAFDAINGVWYIVEGTGPICINRNMVGYSHLHRKIYTPE